MATKNDAVIADAEVVETPADSENETVAAEPEAVKTEEGKEKVDQPNAKPARRPDTRYLNRVTLTGTVVKLVYSKNVAVVTLCTKATMTVSNYPTIFFFGGAAAKAAEYKEGNRVCITGTLQSYDESKLRKGQSPVLVVGLSIERDKPAESKMGDDEQRPIESGIHSDSNEIEIRGQILAIQCNRNNDITLTIRTILNGRWSIIDYPYYARNTNQFLRNVYVHQYVRAIGTIQTANIPVDPEEEDAAENSTKGNIRQSDTDRPRIRTRKKQYFILYDVYSVDGTN